MENEGAMLEKYLILELIFCFQICSKEDINSFNSSLLRITLDMFSLKPPFNED